MTSPRGKIATFYSFKGGVGRTMALANVAYLAANQGQRVLMMDWDLEAPGLWYYFRGLVEVEQLNLYRDAPGVLNVLWEWQRRISQIESIRHSRELIVDFETGEPFANCVLPVLTLEGPGAGAIDYIAAGSETVFTGEPLTYGEALSTFPWSKFNDGYAGNSLIEMWRQWAKRNYDLILIDSRTGFADVAGLCTMAFPDDVVLCMAMNRQNIDGTARVAAEIRRVRQSDVQIRVAPMRVARIGGAEFDNAIARARSTLIRTGGMTDAEVVRDFDQLSIPAADGVPFYESLAPFASSASMFDVLTLAYCRMASELIGSDVKPPAIADVYRERVRRRQDPRTATLEYLAKLNLMEPARALLELDALIDSAIASNDDQGAPSVEYVDALVSAAYSIDKSTVDADAQTATQRLIEFVRSLYHQDSSLWKQSYLTVLTRAVNENGPDAIGSAINNIALFDEIDELLTGDDRLTTLLLRLSYKRRVSFLRYISSSDDDAPIQAASEGLQLADQIRPIVAQGSYEYLETLLGQAELSLLIGDIAHRNLRSQDAMGWYSTICELAPLGINVEHPSAEEFRSLVAQAHMRIALLGSEVIKAHDAAFHAIEALSLSIATVNSYRRLAVLCRLFASMDVEQAMAVRFVAFFDGFIPRISRAMRVGFAPIRAEFLLELLEGFALLGQRLYPALPEPVANLIAAVVECIDAVTAKRRSVTGFNEAQFFSVIDQLHKITKDNLPEDVSLRDAVIRFLESQEKALAPRSEP